MSAASSSRCSAGSSAARRSDARYTGHVRHRSTRSARPERAHAVGRCGGHPEYTADVHRFFELTRGHVILLGPRTYRSVPTFAHEDRTVVAIRSSEQPADVIARYPDRVIYIGGGPPVWTAYAPFIRHWDITRLPYDGDADRWFDPAWLVASEKLA